MRVSVVIPCHNSLRYLPATLESVLAQDLSPDIESYEVVLVDDGGTDDLAAWVAALGDARVRLVRQDNAGVSAARNLGIRSATGDVIGFCDSDDLWLPNTASGLTAAIATDARNGLSYGWYEVIDADDRPTGRVRRCDWEGDVWERFVTINPVPASAVMVRREVFDDVGYFSVNRDKFPIDVEDWELWIRIAATWRVAVAPSIMMRHRRHDSNSSADVDSLAEAYQHMIDVVFADVSPERAKLRPIAMAQADVRLAWSLLNDRQDPAGALERLRSAARHDPTLQRTPEYWRLRSAATALRLTGDRGYDAIRGTARLARVAMSKVPVDRLRRRGGSFVR